MPKIKKLFDEDGRLVKEKKVYSMQEQGAYHTMRAKSGSINPNTNKPYSEFARAKSRGWLAHAKAEANIYNYKNGKKKA